MKLLTVSVAAYNVEKYIRQTLEPFTLPRVHERVEVFVIDDGGWDKTLDIAKEYAARFPNTFFPVHKENGGWGSTVNYSMKHATGKYFKLLDGDDYFEAENLVEYLNCLEQIDSDIIYTPYMEFDDVSGNMLRIVDDKPQLNDGDIIKMEKAVKNIDFFMHNSTIKTSILQEHNIRITEHCFYTDGEYTIKGMAYAKSACALSSVIYCYRLGRAGQSVSMEGLKKHVKDMERMIDEVLNFYRKLDAYGKEVVCERLKDWLLLDNYRSYIMTNDLTSIKRFDADIKKNYPELYGLSIRPLNRKKVASIKFLRFTNFSAGAFKIVNAGWHMYSCVKAHKI